MLFKSFLAVLTAGALSSGVFHTALKSSTPAKDSKAPITGKSSSNSGTLSEATVAPRCGCSVTMPSEASTFSASLRGVRETPNRWHRTIS